MPHHVLKATKARKSSVTASTADQVMA